MNIIYRKYRPKNFSELEGQGIIKQILSSSIKNDSISHAYLFAGPRGTGKTTSARLFAKAVNCANFSKKGDVCNECENCKSIMNNESMDIIEMDAASNRGIEEIRELKDNVNYLPTTLKYKIYIIDEAHMLTKEAFNALLKTLEEPPAHVIFILATTEPHKLPMTILSRVVRFDFQLVNEEIAVNKLKRIVKEEKIPLDIKLLGKIYKLSGGSFRDAESLLAKISNEKEKVSEDRLNEILGITNDSEFKEFLEILQENNIEKLINFIDALEKQNINLNYFLENTLKLCLEEIDEKNTLIAEKIADLLINLGRFNDQYSFTKLKLATIFNQNREVSKESDVKNKIDNSIQIKDIPKQKTEEVKIEVKSEPKQPNQIKQEPEQLEEVKVQASNAEDELKGGLLMFIAKTNRRLAAILNISNISLLENKLIIQNTFKFNVSYISKDENKAQIQDYLEKVQNLKVKIVVEQQKVEVKPTKFVVQNNEKKEQEINKSKKNSENDIDNTDLVESILGT